MKSIKFAATGLLGLACAAAFAQGADESEVKKEIQARLGERASVVSVVRTPYAGLYEVRTANNEILYTDSKAQYLFVGQVIDTATFQDYTKARIDEISRIKFADLPFDSALKMVKGNGKRVIAIFEDPNCGYCKRFRHTLKDVDNITVYTFMYNILSPDSAEKSKNVWCSPNRQKAWDDWMLNGKEPAPAPAKCLTNPNEKIFALGRQMRITGTPTIFFTDGSRIPGAVDREGLEAKLSSLK